MCVTLKYLLRHWGHNSVLWCVGRHTRMLRTMWGVMWVRLALHMSIRALVAHVVGAICMHTSIRMGEAWWRIRYWREGTPHVVVKLSMHRLSGVGASRSIRLRGDGARRRKVMAAITGR